MKKNRLYKKFLEQLAKNPNISVACEKLNFSRQSVYRWRDDDSEFSEAMDKALCHGDDHINDLADSKLVSMINNGNFNAVKYRLDRCNPKYMRPKYDPVILDILKGRQMAERERQAEEIRDKMSEKELGSLLQEEVVPSLKTLDYIIKKRKEKDNNSIQ